MCDHTITLSDRDGIRCLNCGERIAWTNHDALKFPPPGRLAKADPQAEIAALRLEVERLKLERDEARAALGFITDEANEAQGDWSGVEEPYAPDWCSGYKVITLLAADALKAVSHE